MTDINEPLAGSAETLRETKARPAAKAGLGTRNRENLSKPSLPSTDVGTLLLHWITVVAATVSLATGLRISADALDAVISRWMAPILPQGEIWSVHIIAGLTLFGASTAYPVYMALGGLGSRVAPRRIKAIRTAASAKLRWMGVNVLLHWLLYAIVVVLTATGVLLFLGFGGWVVSVHVTAAMSMLAYTMAHIVAHFGYGGWRRCSASSGPPRLRRRSASVAGGRC